MQRPPNPAKKTNSQARKAAIKKERFQDAQWRQHHRNGRTPQEQINRLDLLFGPGVGAKKERAKLAALIEEIKAATQKSKAKKS